MAKQHCILQIGLASMYHRGDSHALSQRPTAHRVSLEANGIYLSSRTLNVLQLQAIAGAAASHDAP